MLVPCETTLLRYDIVIDTASSKDLQVTYNKEQETAKMLIKT
jgi:hypothetical protein